MVTPPTIPEMLKKLDTMYDKEERIFNDASNILCVESDKEKLMSGLDRLKLEYDQLQEDKELLQEMIMHQSNKKNRIGGLNGNI